MDETPQPTEQEKPVTDPIATEETAEVPPVSAPPSPAEPATPPEPSSTPTPPAEEPESSKEESAPAPVTATPESNSSVRYGGFGVRFGAAFIDSILLGVVLMPILKAIFPASSTDESALSNTAYALLVAISVLYYILLTGLIGTTIGKMVLKLKVVGSDGNKPSWGTVLMREVVGKLISGMALGLGYIWVAFDKEKQGWHDKIAHTHVVYK